MRNLTATWRAIAKTARDRGESMAHVPVEAVERLTVRSLTTREYRVVRRNELDTRTPA